MSPACMRKWQDEVERFFAEVAQTDDIQSFDPREFIEAGEHVTVLGFERFVSPGQKGSWSKLNGFMYSRFLAAESSAGAAATILLTAGGSPNSGSSYWCEIWR